MSKGESALDAAIQAAVKARAEAKQKLAAAAYEYAAARKYLDKLRAVRTAQRAERETE